MRRALAKVYREHCVEMPWVLFILPWEAGKIEEFEAFVDV